MPHFVFDTDGSGRISAIYRNCIRQEGSVTLEMANSIVRTYFSAAIRNLHLMQSDTDKPDLRIYGVQSFLMSLAGLEAFVNVYFHQVGRIKGLPEVITLADCRKPIERKLSHLPRLAFGSPLPEQKMLNKKVRELYDLRSSIVHPKLEISSMLFEGVAIDDLVQNFQQVFEDRDFCLEALRWCLLVIARVGRAAHDGRGQMFVNFWTTLSDTDATLSEALGIAVGT